MSTHFPFLGDPALPTAGDYSETHYWPKQTALESWQLEGSLSQQLWDIYQAKVKFPSVLPDFMSGTAKGLCLSWECCEGKHKYYITQQAMSALTQQGRARHAWEPLLSALAKHLHDFHADGECECSPLLFSFLHEGF